MEKRDKMPLSERAKQFMPFASLRGYEQMVKKSEEIISDKIEISEDRIERLSEIMSKIKKGDEVLIEYYANGKYIKKQGIVANIDTVYKTITVIKDRIAFEDVYDLVLIEEDIC
ncbi:MAG: YolD-like family protein [Clostridia bacterium]|nr:YolD-like family protein [Clostridia bacterium]